MNTSELNQQITKKLADIGDYILRNFEIETNEVLRGMLEELNALEATAGAPEPEIEYRVTNYYICPTCRAEWRDKWSCECNDRCPDCNTETKPYESHWHEG